MIMDSTIRRWALLAAVCFALSGCGALEEMARKQREAQIRAERLERKRQEETRLRGYETERKRLGGQLSQTKARALARVARNKLAFTALLAMGHGVVNTFNERWNDDERLGAVVVGIFGLGYCAFNYEECETLTIDLAELMVEMEGLSRRSTCYRRKPDTAWRSRIAARVRSTRLLPIAIRWRGGNARVGGRWRRQSRSTRCWMESSTFAPKTRELNTRRVIQPNRQAAVWTGPR